MANLSRSLEFWEAVWIPKTLTNLWVLYSTSVKIGTLLELAVWSYSTYRKKDSEEAKRD